MMPIDRKLNRSKSSLLSNTLLASVRYFSTCSPSLFYSSLRLVTLRRYQSPLLSACINLISECLPTSPLASFTFIISRQPLSLSLARSFARARSLSPSLPPSLPPCLSRSPALPLSLSFTRTRTHTDGRLLCNHPHNGEA